MVLCILATMVVLGRERRRLRILRERQRVEDPVLFCLDLLHRHKTEEDEALRMAAGYFTAEEVEKAEEAIRAMMLFSGEEEKEEEAKLPKVEGGKDEQEVLFSRLRSLSDSMHLVRLGRRRRYKFVEYAAHSRDAARFLCTM